MLLIYLIDLTFIIGLIGICSKKGLEAALPFATFGMVMLPTSAIITLGPITLSPQRVIIIVLILLYKMYPPEKRDINRTSLALVIALNIAWDVLSALNSVDPGTSIKKVLSQVAEYYLLYVLYAKTISSEQTINKILMAMVVGALGCSVFGAIEAYQGWTVMALFPPVQHMFGMGGSLSVDADRGLRASSTFDHPILFGAALAMAITMAIYLLSVARHRRQKMLLWVAILLMFVNIYKTISRGPWLGLGIGLILLTVLGWRQMRMPLRTIAALTVAVLVIRPGVWESVSGLYYNSLDPNTVVYASYEYRYALKDAAVAALSRDASRALWGFGMDSFYSLHLKGTFGGKEHEFLSCDSVWIATMLETGYVGLLLFALMLLTPAIVAFRDYCKIPRPNCYLSLVLFANLVMYYFMMTSVAMYSWGQNGYMLWILISASMVSGRLQHFEVCPTEVRVFNPPNETAVLWDLTTG